MKPPGRRHRIFWRPGNVPLCKAGTAGNTRNPNSFPWVSLSFMVRNTWVVRVLVSVRWWIMGNYGLPMVSQGSRETPRFYFFCPGASGADLAETYGFPMVSGVWLRDFAFTFSGRSGGYSLKPCFPYGSLNFLRILQVGTIGSTGAPAMYRCMRPA